LGLYYGSYPEIQQVWEQFKKMVDPKVRKDLIGRIQTMIHDKMMFIPVTGSSTPTAFNGKVKGNPFGIQPLVFYTAPFEDIELEGR
jgi:ABC-type transport system substrate-binding protein